MNMNQSQYDEYIRLKQMEIALKEHERQVKERNKELLQAGLCGFSVCAAIFSIFRGW